MTSASASESDASSGRPKASCAPGPRRVVADGRPRVEARGREALQDPAAQLGERRRGGGLDEEAEPRAAVLLVPAREGRELLRGAR